jgi:hypothetical protein
MVTHRTANFIMLISNLPSVRRDSNQTWAVEWFVFLFFFLSHFFFHSTVTPCPSFVKYDRRRSFASHICTATKTTKATTTMKNTIFSSIFFFSFLHIDIYKFIFDSFVHPQVKEKEKKRVAPLPQRQLNTCLSLFFASVIFFLSH